MSFQTKRSMRGIAIGDSVFGGNGGTTASPLANIMATISAAYAIPAVPTPAILSLPPLFSRPYLGWADGAAGRHAVDIASSAGQFATYLQGPQGEFNKAIIELGVNDSSAIHGATETLNQFTTAATNLVNGLLLRYTQMTPHDILWIGPWSTESFIVENPQVDAAMFALSASLGFNYVVWSTVSTKEPGGADRTVGDGIHPNATGAAALAARALTAISFG